MDQKYFSVPFAVAGDVTTVADPIDPTGLVTFTQGWGPNYARDQESDPLATPIDRASTNYLLNVITTALAALQRTGIPEWITTANNDGVALPYAMHSKIRYSATTPGVVFESYVSLIDNNTAVPGSDATKWQPVIDAKATAAVVLAGTDDRSIVTPLGVATLYATKTALFNQSPIVGDARGVSAVLLAASTSITFTVGQIVVQDTAGNASVVRNFNATLNVTAAAGIGGMDTGTAPTGTQQVNTYLMYNPTNGASGLMGVLNGGAVATETYTGAHVPAGYTQSALLGCHLLSAAQFVPQIIKGRRHSIVATPQVATGTPIINAAISIGVPLNAKYVSFDMALSGASINNMSLVIGPAPLTGANIAAESCTTNGASTSAATRPLKDMPLQNGNTVYYSAINSSGVATPNWTFSVLDYTI